MKLSHTVSTIAGFILLFIVYHFPEFYQSFWITAIFKIGFLAIALLIARQQGWKALEGFGLSFQNRWFKVLSIGVLAGIAAFSFSVMVSAGFGFQSMNAVESLPFFLGQLPLTLLMTFFPSIAEDILTRGYLFGHLKRLKPDLWTLLSALVYVLNHIWRLDDGIPVLTYLFFLGLVLGTCVMAQKSLWLALGIHWGANIAFELTNRGVSFGETGNADGATWVLAATWAVVLMTLLWIFRPENSRNVDKG